MLYKEILKTIDTREASEITFDGYEIEKDTKRGVLIHILDDEDRRGESIALEISVADHGNPNRISGARIETLRESNSLRELKNGKLEMVWHLDANRNPTQLSFSQLKYLNTRREILVAFNNDGTGVLRIVDEFGGYPEN